MRAPSVSEPLRVYLGNDGNIWAVNPADARGYGICQAVEGAVAAGGGSGGGVLTANLAGAFTIPAIGTSASATVAMPWVDPGDTVTMNDGIHQFKGTVLANSGTALTLLNTGYQGTSAAGTVVGSAAGVSLCSSPQTDIWTYQDDLLINTSAGGAGVPGCYWTNAALSVVDLADNAHFGVWKLTGSGYIQYNLLTPGNTLPPLAKAVFRCVLKSDHGAESGGDEWYAGFFTQSGNIAYGALLSMAQGFTNLRQANNLGGLASPTPGLVAGTYNGDTTVTTNLGYLQTNFTPAANQWVDLIVVWTPVQARFYCAVEGGIPQLVASIFTNIVTNQEIFPMVTNHSSVSALYIDRVEILYQVAGGNRFKGARLVGL